MNARPSWTCVFGTSASFLQHFLTSYVLMARTADWTLPARNSAHLYRSLQLPQPSGGATSKTLLNNTRNSAVRFLAIACVLFFAAGCGGGGSTSPNRSEGDFSVTCSSSSLTLGSGKSSSVTVGVTKINDFSSNVSVALTGLPTGVSASPSSFNLTPGGQQLVTFSAATTTPAQTNPATVKFQGTSGSLSHNAQLSLSIVAIVTGPHPPIRTQYLRTNSFFDSNSLQFAPPHFAVYDAAHKQFFVSNPNMNEIDVFDAKREVETAHITVPTAWGLDISPYNGTLYAGTYIGDIYQIDTSKLTVIKRYPSSEIGPKGFVATTALVLSDGRLALQGGAGPLAADGYGAPAVWDPIANTLDDGIYDEGFCLRSNNGAFSVSGDRTRILTTWVDEGGGGTPICSYDPIAKSETFGNFPFSTFVRQIIPSPDGKRFFLTSNVAGVGVFDVKTMQMQGQISNSNPNDPTTNGTLPNGAGGAVLSLDGKTLYLVDQTTGAVGAFDTTSLHQTGWVPSYVTAELDFLKVAAIDETGLIAGPISQGVGFVDVSLTQSNKPTMLGPGGATITTGPSTGGTVTSEFSVANVTDGATLNEIYVGNQAGTQPSFVAKPGRINSAEVTTPSSDLTGAVDLTTVLSDGAVGISPEGFSYGPGILGIVPNGSTAEGGQRGAIIAIGLGSTVPQVQVTIGGQDAPVTETHNYQNWLRFTIPPGVAGTAVDVTVTTPSGSTTAKGAFHYTPALESYPLNATLQAGIYDAGRDLYYFTDKTQIQVLSRSAKKWLPPILLPGITSQSQLLAIAESPDGTKLAVSDYGGHAIYVLNPDRPSSARSYSTSIINLGAPDLLSPAGIAVTNGGSVYFATGYTGGYMEPGFLKLETSTGAITVLPSGVMNTATYDEYDRVILNKDGSRVYTKVSSANMWVDTSTDQISFSFSIGRNGLPDMAVSADGSTVFMDGYFTDSSVNAETLPAYIDWETWFPTDALGQKLSPDGSILFQPLNDGIDVIARNTGRLLYRIQIPVTPAAVYDSMITANGKNSFAIITTTGVSFIDLSSLPIDTGYSLPFQAVTHSLASRNNSSNRPNIPRRSWRSSRNHEIPVNVDRRITSPATP